MIPIRGEVDVHRYIYGWTCSNCKWDYSLQDSFVATGVVIGIVGNRSKEHMRAQREFSKHVCADFQKENGDTADGRSLSQSPQPCVK